MSMYQPDIESMDREEIKKIQTERLIWQVKRCYENVAVFRERMQEKGLTPDDIRSLDDLQKLPFTYKKDLRDYYPYGLLRHL